MNIPVRINNIDSEKNYANFQTLSRTSYTLSTITNNFPLYERIIAERTKAKIPLTFQGKYSQTKNNKKALINVIVTIRIPSLEPFLIQK